MGHLYYTHSHQGAGTIKEEDVERYQEPELWDDQNETVFWNDRTPALMNSEQLWLPAQDLHKYKLINTASWRRSS